MQFVIVPLMPEEKPLFYSDSAKEQSCIGHLRGDFGRNGREFWSTWWEHQSNLKTQEFKDEFDTFINSLRKQGILKDRSSMAEYCFAHTDAKIPGAWHSDVFGFRVDTEKHRYFIRCFPHVGDYNFYVYCYRRGQERQQETAQGEHNQPAAPRKRHELER